MACAGLARHGLVLAWLGSVCQKNIFTIIISVFVAFLFGTVWLSFGLALLGLAWLTLAR